jgi:hypothetical protein
VQAQNILMKNHIEEIWNQGIKLLLWLYLVLPFRCFVYLYNQDKFLNRKVEENLQVLNPMSREFKRKPAVLIQDS